MQKSKAVRYLVLSIFFLLVAGFVAFRAGLFETQSSAADTNSIQELHFVSNQIPITDSPPRKDTERARMYSSKSGAILPRDYIKKTKDTVVKKDTSAIKIDSFWIDEHMGSSKSFQIYKPTEVKAKKDSAKRKKERN